MSVKKFQLTLSDDGPDLSLFEDWVLKNYGGNSRTKTITKEKYVRICALLRGDQQRTSNAKFRFWVRSKGFRLLKHNITTDEIFNDPNGELYVSLHAKEETSTSMGSIEQFLRTNLPPISFFRKVAVVDQFYDIIKEAHIDVKGKHAGQKKTYRLVSDTYAFLPREVITFYLLNCDTCKPRIQKYGPIQAKIRNSQNSSMESTLRPSSCSSVSSASPMTTATSPMNIDETGDRISRSESKKSAETSTHRFEIVQSEKDRIQPGNNDGNRTVIMSRSAANSIQTASNVYNFETLRFQANRHHQRMIEVSGSLNLCHRYKTLQTQPQLHNRQQSASRSTSNESSTSSNYLGLGKQKQTDPTSSDIRYSGTNGVQNTVTEDEDEIIDPVGEFVNDESGSNPVTTASSVLSLQRLNSSNSAQLSNRSIESRLKAYHGVSPLQRLCSTSPHPLSPREEHNTCYPLTHYDISPRVGSISSPSSSYSADDHQQVISTLYETRYQEMNYSTSPRSCPSSASSPSSNHSIEEQRRTKNYPHHETRYLEDQSLQRRQGDRHLNSWSEHSKRFHSSVIRTATPGVRYHPFALNTRPPPSPNASRKNQHLRDGGNFYPFFTPSPSASQHHNKSYHLYQRSLDTEFAERHGVIDSRDIRNRHITQGPSIFEQRRSYPLSVGYKSVTADKDILRKGLLSDKMIYPAGSMLPERVLFNDHLKSIAHLYKSAGAGTFQGKFNL